MNYGDKGIKQKKKLLQHNSRLLKRKQKANRLQKQINQPQSQTSLLQRKKL